jgi:DNA-binding Lrp family transcriptional regulator
MGKQMTLRPLDIPVALRLVEEPGSTYQQIHEDLGISASTAHGAVERLTRAGLVHPHQRKVNRSALLEFLEHGIQYAFPADVSERRVRGVPTAHAAPVFGGEIVGEDVYVWPHPNGPAMGDAMEPLYDQATSLPTRCASVYDMLALVDALRVGRARERRIATQKLRERIRPRTAPDDA